jgi:hypothetical protein
VSDRIGKGDRVAELALTIDIVAKRSRGATRVDDCFSP